jgi:hypothetical protein
MITNDGPELVSTNYWETPNCKAGLFVLSTNADCVRLLMPPSHQSSLSDMKGALEVLLTRAVSSKVATASR